MKRVLDLGANIFKPRSRKSLRTSARTQSSRLRCEALEERTVLSLTPCAALLETAVLDTTSALFSEETPEFDSIAISLTPSSATSAPLSADELFEEASALETTALDQAVLDPANQTLEEVDEFFARYSNGWSPGNYFLPSMFSSDTDDSDLFSSDGVGSARSGGGDANVMSINIQGAFTYDDDCGDFEDFVGASGMFHEGRNTQVGEDAISCKDYVSIALPALPYLITLKEGVVILP